MLHFYPGDDLGDQKFYQRRNALRASEGATDPLRAKRAERALAGIRKRHALPDPRITEREIKKFNAFINDLRHNSPGTSLGMAKRMFYGTTEAVHPELFDTLMDRYPEVALVDGFEMPAHDAWKMLAQPPPDGNMRNFKRRKTTRRTRPDIPQRYDSPREEVVPVETQGLDGPSYRPEFWMQDYNISWEDTTIAEFLQLLMAIYQDGSGANEAVERFVFIDNLQNAVTLHVDGADRTLFADHTAIRGFDNRLGALGTVDADAFKTAITTTAPAMIDNRPMTWVPGFLIVPAWTSVHIDALTLLDPEAVKDPGNANNTINLYRRGKVFNVTLLPVEVLDTTTLAWYLAADPMRHSSLAFVMDFLRGQSTPEWVDLDGPSGSRQSRASMERTYRSRLIGSGTWMDVAAVLKATVV